MEWHQLAPPDVVAEEEVNEPTPLLTPEGGLPKVIDTENEFRDALEKLAAAQVPSLWMQSVHLATDTARVPISFK